MLSDTESSQAMSSGSDVEFGGCSSTLSEMTDDLDDLTRPDSMNTTARKQPVLINQYAQHVLDFSSQYGSDFSISYTAYNITGRPSKFPDYGDFPETFAMVNFKDCCNRYYTIFYLFSERMDHGGIIYHQNHQI